MQDIKVISDDRFETRETVTEERVKVYDKKDLQYLIELATGRRDKAQEEVNAEQAKIDSYTQDLAKFDDPDVKKAIDDAKAAVAPLPEEPITP